MRFTTSLIAAVLLQALGSTAAPSIPLSPLPHQRRATAVTGSAEGFAGSVTGGGAAAAVTPTSTAQLVSYLGDASPRVIVLNRSFDFRKTEGTKTTSGCAPWGTGSACQIAINKDNWCTNYQPDAPVVGSVMYDAAGVLGITVASHKTLVGSGSKGVILGKGLRIVSGASNIIIQNVHITEINPQYVWGGDGITINGADLVWIDHVKTSRIGRQHIVLGESASNRVTISNSEIDGQTDWSATCDGNHYWGLYFTGSNDMVTLKGNYIHHTSGRSPKVGGNTLLHAVNNYFGPSSGHDFEIGAGGNVLAEGNVFSSVGTPVEAGVAGQLFTANAGSGGACSASLGRQCVANTLKNSGAFSGSNTNFLTNFVGKTIAAASAASAVDPSKAGFGKI